jgi:hypothetical protein
MFGSLAHGYTADFANALTALFRAGICPHTVFTFPDNADEYPLIYVPSAVRFTDCENDAMRRYLNAGGKVVVTGPSAISDCVNGWDLPNRVEGIEPRDFFTTYPGGIKPLRPDWVSKTPLMDCPDPEEWRSVGVGMWYNPNRKPQDIAQVCAIHAKPMPVNVSSADGYLCTMFEDEHSLIVHLLAEDYETDIDHNLDEMRYHRSRVNYINHVRPLGISGEIKIAAPIEPEVYTPLQEEAADIRNDGGIYSISVPTDCAYVILKFSKSSE